MHHLSLPAFALVAALAAPAHGQLQLADALRHADSAAVPNRAAAARRAESAALALTPLHGILPSVRAEAGVVRTNDPVGAFGTILRQRRITAADFDPARLNHPAPITNHAGGLIVEMPVFNADAWVGRRAAGSAAGAARAGADWTRLSTRADVVRAYYGAILAHELVTALEAARRAATAHVGQAESMQRNGLVTASDALLASVRTGELEADLLAARSDATVAGRALAVLIGEDRPAAAPPGGPLPTADRLRAFASSDTLTSAFAPRADVVESRLAANAARTDALRARTLVLPRLNSFARYDWNDPVQPWTGERSWTVGVMASLSLFSGAGELAERRATAARELAAGAMADGTAAQAALEAERAASGLRVALGRLTIAERSSAQGMEAHRIVSRRYEGGLATIAELLDAAAADSRTATALAKARYDVVSALAVRRLAIGLDPGALAALDTPATAGSSGSPDPFMEPIR